MNFQQIGEIAYQKSCLGMNGVRREVRINQQFWLEHKYCAREVGNQSLYNEGNSNHAASFSCHRYYLLEQNRFQEGKLVRLKLVLSC